MAVNFLVNELPVAFPGAKTVSMLQPYKQTIIAKESNVPDKDVYTPFEGDAFEEGVQYFELKSGIGSVEKPFVYEATVDTEKNPGKTYYTKTVVPGFKSKRTVVYECYTDGMVPCQVKDPDGGTRVEIRNLPTEIVRTITETNGDTTEVVRDHATAYWIDRETADYRPICRRLSQDSMYR